MLFKSKAMGKPVWPLCVFHDGGAGIFDGDAQHGVTVLAGCGRQLVDQRHFVAAGIAPAGKKIHHQWFTAKALQCDRFAVQRFQDRNAMAAAPTPGAEL